MLRDIICHPVTYPPAFIFYKFSGDLEFCEILFVTLKHHMVIFVMPAEIMPMLHKFPKKEILLSKKIENLNYTVFQKRNFANHLILARIIKI